MPRDFPVAADGGSTSGEDALMVAVADEARPNLSCREDMVV